MSGLARRTAVLLVIAGLTLAGCDVINPPSTRPGGSTQPSTAPASGPAASGSAAPPATSPSSPTPSASPGQVGANAEGFWKLAARALSKSGRLRLVITGAGTRELRYEPKASGAIADGALASVCVGGAAYIVQGFQSTTVPGRWACGGSALISSFRRSGQPVYAWNTRLPADTRIRERLAIVNKGRWRWTYTATSTILKGPVTTTLLIDVETGRLISGTRKDPTGNIRYTFSYTTIFAPIQLP